MSSSEWCACQAKLNLRAGLDVLYNLQAGAKSTDQLRHQGLRYYLTTSLPLLLPLLPFVSQPQFVRARAMEWLTVCVNCALPAIIPVDQGLAPLARPAVHQ